MNFGSVLVTGATGFLGRHLVAQLLRRNASDRICILARNEHAMHDTMEMFGRDKRLRPFIGDVRHKDRMRRAMNRIDLVIHAAALKRVEVGQYDAPEMIETNIIGTMNVVGAAEEMGVRKVVYISSDKAFQPAGTYGATKLAGEGLCLSMNDCVGEHGPRFAAVRYGNVWLSTGSVAPKWRAEMVGRRMPKMTDPECTRFFMRIEEAVALVLDTAATMQGGEINIPDLPAYRLGDLAEAMGIQPEITGLPSWEKRHESMGPNHCSADARRMSIKELRMELWEAGLLPAGPRMRAA